MNKDIKKIVILFTVILAVFIFVPNKIERKLGSSNLGQDYTATSTRYFPDGSLTNLSLLKNGATTIGRITITGANTGVIRLWNATTSNVNSRTGNKATSSLEYIEIPASLVAGDYDFDVEFNTGLLYELVSGNAPTSTIIYKK